MIALVCLVVFFVLLFSAMEFGNIAKMKGHEFDIYFWWCFLMGPVGWAMVIALPDRKDDVSFVKNNVSETVDDFPEL